MKLSCIKLTAAVILTMSMFVTATASAAEFKSWRTNNGNVIQENGNAYLALGRPNILEAPALKMILNDPNPLNDPLIIDLRPQGEYNMGHISGAIWIADFNAIALPENLDKLDDALAAHIQQTGNDQIVVYCHLGQMSGLASGVLGTLGYNVKTLKLGYILGWGMGTMSPM